jgi:hypothetical protein
MVSQGGCADPSAENFIVIPLAINKVPERDFL